MKKSILIFIVLFINCTGLRILNFNLIDTSQKDLYGGGNYSSMVIAVTSNDTMEILCFFGGIKDLYIPFRDTLFAVYTKKYPDAPILFQGKKSRVYCSEHKIIAALFESGDGYLNEQEYELMPKTKTSLPLNKQKILKCIFSRSDFAPKKYYFLRELEKLCDGQ